MKTKHTPGPWAVEDEGDLDHEGKLWIVDSQMLCVAEIEIEKEAIIGPDEANANAIIISAAPSSWALAVEISKDPCGHPGSGPCFHTRAIDLLKEAR